MATNLDTLDTKNLSEQAKNALAELGKEFEDIANDVELKQWAADVSPAIVEYAVQVAAGSVKAKNELDVIRAIATAKAARIAMRGGQAVADRMAMIAIVAGRMLALGLTAL